MGPVAIRGDGVAARACAHLLGKAGIPVAMEAAARTRVPAIVVGAATQALACDVFERSSLFADLPRIEQRVVAWGVNRGPVTLPHAAVVISEEALLERLSLAGPARPAGPTHPWTIYASRPLPDGVEQLSFGTRRASVAPVQMKPGAPPACWVESLESGWLFLIPGWLIAVGGAPDLLLGESCLVAEQVLAIAGAAAEFPAYPRIANPLCGEGWLACGAAAMTFDPLCGDGTGNAMREAILASAVMRAVARGERPEPLLAHYRARLLAGFRRHLELTLEFYRAGNSGAWWREETRALADGIAWRREQPETSMPFRYRLEGFDLVPLSGR
jgi:hypothetical protein